MDFRFTPEQEAFRQEIRGFARRELPPWWEEEEDEMGSSDAAWEVTQAISKKLAQRGWLVMGWPPEWGGRNASPLEQLIYQEETSYQRVPGTSMGVGGVSWVGPSIIKLGTREQKQAHLPGIAQGERYWCTLYSEPGTGSDLAGLQTRATSDGDDYIVNGQKIWTSSAHRAGWGWLAARTNPNAPKHKGISMLLVDMNSPGVTVQPIINMAGQHSLNQVFFDDVRVPKVNRVGEENRGWYQLAEALDFERSGIRWSVTARRILEPLMEYVKEQALGQDPWVRNALAEMAVEIEVSRLLSYNVAWVHSTGAIPNKEASLSKLFGSELQQRLARVAMPILGLYGQLETGSKWAPLQGRVERYYLTSVSNTVEAGTSEIQRYIIAGRGLGLPR